MVLAGMKSQLEVVGGQKILQGNYKMTMLVRDAVVRLELLIATISDWDATIVHGSTVCRGYLCFVAMITGNPITCSLVP